MGALEDKGQFQSFPQLSSILLYKTVSLSLKVNEHPPGFASLSPGLQMQYA